MISEPWRWRRQASDFPKGYSSSNISWTSVQGLQPTVYPKKYAHGFVVLRFVVVMQSFIMNSQEVFIHIHQGCFAGTGAIVRLPQCQWSKPDGYGKISQCITTTKHSKAKTVCIFLGIYCRTNNGFIQYVSWHWIILCHPGSANSVYPHIARWRYNYIANEETNRSSDQVLFQ